MWEYQKMSYTRHDRGRLSSWQVDPRLHRWVSHKSNQRRRSWYSHQTPIRPSRNTPYGHRKALQQLQNRDWSTYKSSLLDYRLVRSSLYSGLSYWCTLSPGSPDKQQIPRPSQSNKRPQRHLQRHLTVDTSTLWNNGQRRSWPLG